VNTAEKAILGIIALGAGGFALYYILKSKPAVAQSTSSPSSTTSNVCSSQYCPPASIPQPIILVNEFYQNVGSGISVWVDGQYAGQTDASGSIYTEYFTPCQWHEVKAEGNGYFGQGKLGYFCYPNSMNINNILKLCPSTGVFYLGISADKPITVIVSINGPTSASTTVNVSTVNGQICVDSNCSPTYCGSAIIRNIPSGHYTYTVTDLNGNVLWSGSEDVCGDEYNGANVSSSDCLSPSISIPSWKL
jgi:hypothetical protein